MEITLNSKPFDVTLEDEKNLGELFSGISEWLNQTGYEITELIQDGEKLELYNDEWQDNLLNSINNLDIITIPGSARYIDDLQVIYQSISLLLNAVDKDNFPLIDDLLSELPYITGVLDIFLSKKDISDFGKEKMINLINAYTNSGKRESAKKNMLLEYLNNLTLILKSRIKEVTSPYPELQDTTKKLKSLIPIITDVALMLQTGNDKKAMDSVLQFIDLSEKLIRIFPFLVEQGYTDIREQFIEDDNFNNFYKDLNDILIELVEAFNINDSILIGDLMEYEIAPGIEKLLEYLKLVEKVKEDNTGEMDVSGVRISQKE